MTDSIPETKDIEAKIEIDAVKPVSAKDVQEGLMKTLKIGLIGEIVTLVMMIAITNIVYGTGWNTAPYTRNRMAIAIWLPSSSVNGIIERTVTYIVDNRLDYGLNYKFEFVYSNEKSLENLREDVDHGRYYGALGINEGASEQFYSYLNGSSSTQPTAVYYYDQARVGAVFQFPISSIGQTIILYSNINITTTLINQLSHNKVTVSSPIAKVVNVVSLNTVNLHEVDRFGLFVVSGSGSLQMYLVMLCHSLGLAPLTASMVGHGIKRVHRVQLAGFHRLLGALYLSIFPMVITLCLGSGNRHIVHSAKTFFITWAFTWLAFSIYGGIVYHLVNIFGLGVAVVLSIIFLNFMQATSATSVPLAASPLFYSLGYGFPFFNVSLGFKSIWFDSQSNLFSQAIGILFIWWFEMFLAVQVEVYDVVEKTKKWWRNKLHLYPDIHNVEADQREESLKQVRLSQKKAEIIASIKSKKNQLSSKINDHLDGLSNPYQQAVVDVLESTGSIKEGLKEKNLVIDSVEEMNGNIANQGTEIRPTLPENADNIVDVSEVNNDDIIHTSESSGVHSSESKKYSYLPITIHEPVIHHTIHEDNEIVAIVHDNDEENYDHIVVEDDGLDHDQTSLFDPSVRPQLLNYIKKSIAFEIALTIIFLVLMCFTYGANWDPYYYQNHIHIAIVNEEGGSVTSPYTIALKYALSQSSLTSAYRFTFNQLEYNNEDYNSLKNLVDDRHFFAGFIVNGNSTNQLYSQLTSESITSLSSTTPSYTYFYNGARGGSYINNYMLLWVTNTVATMNAEISKLLVTQANELGTINDYNPYILSVPTSLDIINLHPFPEDAPGSDTAISVAATAMYLGMIAHCIIVVKSHEPLASLGISYTNRVILKGLHILIGSLFLSVAPAVSMVWYGFNMSASTFFAFWAMLWLSMCSFGSYMMTNYHLFGFSFGGVVNILIFALNTSCNTASLPIELLPRFFRIGYGLPAAQFVIGSRYILFGSNEPGFRNAIGVLFGWIFTVFFLSLNLIYRKRKINEFSDATTKLINSRVLPSLRKVFSINVNERMNGVEEESAPIPSTSDHTRTIVMKSFSQKSNSLRMSMYENYQLNTTFHDEFTSDNRDSLHKQSSHDRFETIQSVPTTE